jgi:uracil-DNA glycosylase family 4
VTVADLDLGALRVEAESCVACRLAETRTTVVFASGSPNSDLMIVGEAPGRDEDLAGQPFVGRSGKLLDQLIEEELGRTRADCYVTNVVKCRPPSNRDPLPDEVDKCRRFLDGQVGVVAPRVVITLGNFAMRSLLNTTDGITRRRGSAYRFASGYVIPTFHPAAALRGGPSVVAQMRDDFAHAAAALLRGGR